MEAAVNVASTLIDKGAILLSPACASFEYNVFVLIY
jgi:UDP-N-acetylmuramoylalanine-D-glutamate ligase